MRISSAVQKLLLEGNLAQAEMVYQEACTQLLGWIQEHLDLAKENFPNFFSEEDQMRLLSPGAAVSLQRKAKSLERLYEELGTDDPEELERLPREAKWQKMRDSGNDMAYMWADEMDGLTDQEREDFLREIGDAGEEYAYRSVRNYFLTEGYEIQTEEGGRILLSAPAGQEAGGKAEILQPDTESYHQSGWDILVFLWDADNTPVEYYLEVKTHTPKSASQGLLPLSNEQMKLAAGKGEHYVLLSVVYDYHSKTVIRMDTYQDLIRCLADGSVCHAEGKYLLRCQNAGMACA